MRSTASEPWPTCFIRFCPAVRFVTFCAIRRASCWWCWISSMIRSTGSLGKREKSRGLCFCACRMHCRKERKRFTDFGRSGFRSMRDACIGTKSSAWRKIIFCSLQSQTAMIRRLSCIAAAPPESPKASCSRILTSTPWHCNLMTLWGSWMWQGFRPWIFCRCFMARGWAYVSIPCCAMDSKCILCRSST